MRTTENFRPTMPLFKREIPAFRAARLFGLGVLATLVLMLLVLLALSAQTMTAAGAIYIIVLLPVALGLMGAALGKWAAGLKIWHLSHLPDDVAPITPTPAQDYIARRLSQLKLAVVLIVAAGLGVYGVGFGFGVVLLVPALIGVLAGIYTLTGVIRTPGASRTEALHRDAIWQQMPRIKASRIRQERKMQTFKRAVIVIIPLAILHNIITNIAPGGTLETISRAFAFIAVMGVVFWPQASANKA